MRTLAVLLACLAGTAQAHDGVDHAPAAEAAARPAMAPAPQGLPLPFAVGGPFMLTDQNGHPRSEADPGGAFQLLFFGYANCPSICATALPLIADVTDRLSAEGITVTPVMITIDPARDTVQTIGPALAKHHPDFVGLTGTEAALARAYEAFSIDRNMVFEDPQYGPIFAHGSFIYLLDGNGTVLSVLPPVLSAERLTEIAKGYASATAAGSNRP